MNNVESIYSPDYEMLTEVGKQVDLEVRKAVQLIIDKYKDRVMIRELEGLFVDNANIIGAQTRIGIRVLEKNRKKQQN